MPLYLPELYEEDTVRSTTAVFRGLNRHLQIQDGEFYDMQNLTSDDMPLLSVRPRRGLICPQGADRPTGITARTLGKEGIARPVWLDGVRLCSEGALSVDLTPYGLEDDGTERRILSMGAYLIVIPDMIYVSTVDEEDRGRMEDFFSTSEATLTVTVCDHAGEPATYAQVARPDTPKNGDIWHKTGEKPALYRYDAETAEWYPITGYLRIAATRTVAGVGTHVEPIALKSAMRAGDTVRLSGVTDAIDGTVSVQGVEPYSLSEEAVSAFWITGMLDSPALERVATAGAPFTVSRAVPRMDHVLEAGNRLWGCRFGEDGQGHFVNEIYASARGDFFRWMAGDAEDEDAPVTLSVGTDGPFTAAVNYDGVPLFFKERGMHRVSGCTASAFTLYDTPCAGVARGAHKSLAVVGGVLYYKSPTAVMAFDGSLPVSVSDKLGRLSGYTSAVGGACGGKYYLSLWKKSGTGVSDRHLYVLDTERGVWHREDATECESMASVGDNLYFVEITRIGESVTHAIRSVEVSPDAPPEARERAAIPWYAETGSIGLETPDAKYVTRLSIRLHPAPGALVRVSVRYDSRGGWKQVLATEGGGMRTLTVPVTPKRCDHVRLRLDGVGDCRVYSITKTLERAEDL